MSRRNPALVLVLLLLVGALLGARPAEADDTKAAVKAFKKALKAEKWQDRRDAYLTVADYDSAEVVKAVLDAMVREQNPAVRLTGLDVLGGLASKGAQERMVAEATKAKGERKQFVLLVLAKSGGDTAVPILRTIVQGKDGPAIAQAALALGRKEVKEAIPELTTLLAHKDWQVRRAGAMALANIAQPPPPEPKDGKPPPKDFRWPVPEEMKAPEITQALIRALEASDGVERGAIIQVLAEIHEVDHGLNIAAWKAVAAGTEVTKRLERKREWPPAAFGIPLYGKRIVFIYDNSLRSGDPHRFGTGDRLQELCQVPGGPPLVSSRLLTVGQFARAHIGRAMATMASGQKFELITFNATVKPLYGKFASSGGASRKLFDDLFANLEPDDGINTYGAFTEALDMGGASDSKAWKKGPDEIVFITCNQPTQGELKDADVVAAAVGLKGRMRMVRIHTIGIESHPYAMLASIAKVTGGVYRNLYE